MSVKSRIEQFICDSVNKDLARPATNVAVNMDDEYPPVSVAPSEPVQVEGVTLHGSGRGTASLMLTNGFSTAEGKRIVGLYHAGAAEIYVESGGHYFYYSKTISGGLTVDFKTLEGCYAQEDVSWISEIAAESVIYQDSGTSPYSGFNGVTRAAQQAGISLTGLQQSMAEMSERIARNSALFGNATELRTDPNRRQLAQSKRKANLKQKKLLAVKKQSVRRLALNKEI